MRGISVTYFVFILYICVWVYWEDGNKFMYLVICLYVIILANKHLYGKRRRYVIMYVCVYALHVLTNIHSVERFCSRIVSFPPAVWFYIAAIILSSIPRMALSQLSF